MRIDGVDTVDAGLSDISRLVGSVCQDIDSQMVASVVEDEVLYGMENFGVPKFEIEGRLRACSRKWASSTFAIAPSTVSRAGRSRRSPSPRSSRSRPRVLVLDEPTAELDPASSIAVFDLLARYAAERGISVVVVEQKIALLARYADTIIVVEDGRVRYEGEPGRFSRMPTTCLR